MDFLQICRDDIDAIDRQILELLAKRFETVEKVGAYKKAHDLPPLQPERWRAVLESRRAWAEELALAPDFVESVWNRFHEYALELEKNVAKPFPSSHGRP